MASTLCAWAGKGRGKQAVNVDKPELSPWLGSSPAASLTAPRALEVKRNYWVGGMDAWVGVQPGVAVLGSHKLWVH